MAPTMKKSVFWCRSRNVVLEWTGAEAFFFIIHGFTIDSRPEYHKTEKVQRKMSKDTWPPKWTVPDWNAFAWQGHYWAYRPFRCRFDVFFRGIPWWSLPHTKGDSVYNHIKLICFLEHRPAWHPVCSNPGNRHWSQSGWGGSIFLWSRENAR